MIEWVVDAKVLRVIDGDTVEVNLDLGWKIYKIDSVRLAKINAPETSTIAGKNARDFLRGMLPVGTEVTVVSHSLDKYGRALASLFRVSDDLDLCDAMIDAGHAVAWSGKGPKP